MIFTSSPVVCRQIRTHSFARGQSLFVLNRTIHRSLQILIVETHLRLESAGDVTGIHIFVQYLVGRSRRLLL